MPGKSFDCGCEQGCGRSFTIDSPGRGQRRVYAVDCPYHLDRVNEKRRASARRAYERRRKASPRVCQCGCGRVLPRYVRYHPDCPSRVGKERDRARATDSTRAHHRCRECWDQPWRRDPKAPCVRCGGKYAPEKVKPAGGTDVTPLGDNFPA